MKAVIVCVDFADLLALTLPYNRHHFDEVLIVTSPEDRETKEVARAHKAHLYKTYAFWRHGADFNKWLALELALDEMGRSGPICLLDVDILWPKKADVSVATCGKLVTPFRRMMENIEGLLSDGLPEEKDWWKFPLHPQQREFAGYTQIFHGEDPHLPKEPPWHQTDWRHAGGADSFFQALWSDADKVRPPFEVLHLGAAGENWCGRATQFLDGTKPFLADVKKERLRNYIKGRCPGEHRFDREKLL